MQINQKPVIYTEVIDQARSSGNKLPGNLCFELTAACGDGVSYNGVNSVGRILVNQQIDPVNLRILSNDTLRLNPEEFSSSIDAYVDFIAKLAKDSEYFSEIIDPVWLKDQFKEHAENHRVLDLILAFNQIGEVVGHVGQSFPLDETKANHKWLYSMDFDPKPREGKCIEDYLASSDLAEKLEKLESLTDKERSILENINGSEIIIATEIAMDKDYRGKGLVQELLRMQEEQCRGVGAKVLIYAHDSENKASKRFLHKQGFITLPGMSFEQPNASGEIKTIELKLKFL